MRILSACDFLGGKNIQLTAQTSALIVPKTASALQRALATLVGFRD